LTFFLLGVFTIYMPEIIKKLPLEIKKNKLKTGIAVALSAYWGVIIIGTLVNFN